MLKVIGVVLRVFFGICISIYLFGYIKQLSGSVFVNQYNEAATRSWSLSFDAAAIICALFVCMKLFGEPKLAVQWISNINLRRVALAFFLGGGMTLSAILLSLPFSDFVFLGPEKYILFDIKRNVLHSIAPVVFEELWERGFVFWLLIYVFSSSGRIYIPILISAALFSWLHNWHSGPAWSSYSVQLNAMDYFATAVVLNILVLKTNSIWPAVSFHLATNMVILSLYGGHGNAGLLSQTSGPWRLLHILFMASIVIYLLIKNGAVSAKHNNS